MKIIHIAGNSGTGKTTLIQELIPELVKQGSVGTIKHIGDHVVALEEGKDTSIHFRSGASIAIGIDREKALAAIHKNDLTSALTFLCDAGMKYCIVESFKSHPFPKVVLGDADLENCILRNPSVSDILAALDQFEEFYTMQGLITETKASTDLSRAGCILSFNGIVRENTDGEITEFLEFNDPSMDDLTDSIEEDMKKVPGVLAARFYHRKGRFYAGEDLTYFAIVAEHRFEAFDAMAEAIDRLKADLHNKGKKLEEC